MPTVQVQFSEVKRQRGSTNVHFLATDGANRQIERVVAETMFDSWNDVGAWLTAGRGMGTAAGEGKID